MPAGPAPTINICPDGAVMMVASSMVRSSPAFFDVQSVLRRGSPALQPEHISRACAASAWPAGSNDPLARDSALAALEAILLIADEPLPIRKLVQATVMA